MSRNKADQFNAYVHILFMKPQSTIKKNEIKFISTIVENFSSFIKSNHKKHLTLPTTLQNHTLLNTLQHSLQNIRRHINILKHCHRNSIHKPTDKIVFLVEERERESSTCGNDKKRKQRKHNKKKQQKRK